MTWLWEWKGVVDFAKKVGIVMGAVLATAAVTQLLFVNMAKPVIRQSVADEFAREDSAIARVSARSEMNNQLQTEALFQIRIQLAELNGTAKAIKKGVSR